MSKSVIYTRNGDVKEIDKTHNGKPFFRKEAHLREIIIATILRKYPHPNIVTFYTISPTRGYVDMEMLDTATKIPKRTLLQTLKTIKAHLQSIGIMYIDWKPDQVGITADGTIKLFDFDASGIIDTKTKEWIYPAPRMQWSHRQATAAGLTDPYEIDNYAFTLIYPPKGFKPV